MRKTLLVVTALATVSACDMAGDGDSVSRGLIPPWQRDVIAGRTGGGDAQSRRSGQIVGAQTVEAGQGTIFPGRQPLVRRLGYLDANGEQTVSLTLVDVSIEEAAAAIFGEVLRENYVIDPRVSGTVTIRSIRPISRTTAIEVFELALQQNGAALVRRGETFAIVPLTADLAIGASTGREVEPGYSFRVIPLMNIGAQEMAAILQPFAGEGIVGIDAKRNVIVLAGTSADQRAWQETITSFDVDWLANRSVGIFPVRGRSAQSIVNGLNEIVGAEDGLEPLVVFEVIPENNSILAVAKTPKALENTAVWIARLTKATQNDAQVYSYDMQYARAAQVAPTLASVLGIEVVASEAGNVPGDDVELAVASFEGLDGADFNSTRVVASEATNTLLIHATPAEYDRILGILHRLDVPPRQVLVEATIVEVSLTDDLRYGVQYLFRDGDVTARLGAGADFQNEPGFTLTLDSPPEVIIDALAGRTEVNVVSSPNLMILNNESARLVVGDQVPVAVRQAQDVDEDETVFVSSVEFRDTGVIFEVTPRINSSGAVTLDITQEVSSVAGVEATTLTPTISQRIIDSSVSVDTGETIVLGGLFSNSLTRSRSGIPVLKDIPVAGNLFGRTSKNGGRTELVVLITPRIVNDRMDARRVTRQLRDRVSILRETAPSLSTDVKVPLMGTDKIPVMAPQEVSVDPRTIPVVEPVGADVSRAAATALDAPALRPAGLGHDHAVLGPLRTRAAAEAHWASLSGHPALTGKRPVYTERYGMVTLSVGPLPSAEAARICRALKTCFTAQQL